MSAKGTITATSEGSLTVPARKSNGDVCNLELSSVLVAPDAGFKLTAVRSLVDAGHAVLFADQRSGIFLNHDAESFVPFTESNNLYYLDEDTTEIVSIATESAQTISTSEYLHLCFGHVNRKYMSLMRRTAKGMPELPSKVPSFVCHCCQESKSRHANKALSSTSRAQEPLELIHIDTAGPMKVQSVQGERYVTVFVDDKTRYRWCYCHRLRDDLLNIFKKFVADAQALKVYSKIGAIRRVRTDNGGEYISGFFEQFLLDSGIRHEYSNPDEQFGNGRAERSIGLIFVMARAMHLTSGLATFLWSFAVKHAVHLLNRLPTRANPRYISPYEAMRGNLPDVSKLRPWGCLVYCYVIKHKSKDWKTSARGIPSAYMGDGEADGSKAYIAFNLTTRAIIFTTSVWFDPTFLPGRKKTDRRVISCSFGSYPDSDTELTQLYSYPQDDDLLEQVNEIAPQLVAQLRNQAEDDLRSQNEQALLDQLRRTDLHPNFAVNDQESPHFQQLRMQILDDLSDQGPLRLPDGSCELLGYDSDADMYLVRANSIVRFYPSEAVLHKLQTTGGVYSTVLGISFESYDDEQDEFITLKDDVVSEIDRKVIETKLQHALQSYLNGELSHDAYTNINTVMSNQYRDMLSPRRESVSTDACESNTSTAIVTLMAVQEFVLAVQGQDDFTPKTLHQALSSPEREQWKEAVREELNKLIGRGVFKFIKSTELPSDKKAFPLHLIFKRKKNQHGEVVRYKARLVLDGSKMRENIDYFGSYAPVTDFTSFRLIVAYGHAKHWLIKQYDIVLAFTCARPQNPTFVRFVFDLEGIVEGIRKFQIAELVWNLYGDVSAPRSWAETFKAFLTGLGFSEVGGHPCVMIKIQGDEILLLTTYVDDIVATASNPELFVWFETELGKRFEYTNQGDLNWCLGVEFSKSSDGRCLILSQQKYSKEILERFGMSNVKAMKTPMDSHVKLSLADCPKVVDPLLQKEYRSKIGSLQYLSLWTRPDLSYSVAILSRFLHCPGIKQLQAANRVLQYLCGTIDKGITYVSDSTLLSPIYPDLNRLVAFSDADFAGCLDTAKSMTGFVVLMNNSLIAWKAGRQASVMLSTSAAETQALMKATIIVTHLRCMLHDMKCQQVNPTVTYVDNKTAMYVSEGKQVMSETAKHCTVQCKYVAQQVSLGVIFLQYIQTGEQRADIFTKALSGPIFRYHRDALMNPRGSEGYSEHYATVSIPVITCTSLKLYSVLKELQRRLVLNRWRIMFVKSNDSMKHEQSMWDDEQVRLKRTIKTMRIRLAGKTHADKLDGLSYRGTIAQTSLLHDFSVRTGVSQPTQFQSSSRHNIGETVTSHSSLANSGNQVTLAKSGKRVKFRSDN